MDRPELKVTVVYCPPGGEDVTELALAAGATVGDAVDASGVVGRHPGLAGAVDLGVWGRRAAADQPLEDGDRVELYRPLTLDPKDARRLRADVRRRRGAG